MCKRRSKICTWSLLTDSHLREEEKTVTIVMATVYYATCANLQTKCVAILKWFGSTGSLLPWQRIATPSHCLCPFHFVLKFCLVRNGHRY